MFTKRLRNTHTRFPVPQ